MKKLGKLLLVALASFSAAACGKKEEKVTLSESSVQKVTCELESDNKTYKCDVKSDGVNDAILVLGANVFIDSENEVITKVTIYQNAESDEYGKALLGGTLRVPDAQAFYEKYVAIGENGLKISEVKKLKYTTKEDVKAVCNRETAEGDEICGSGGKKIYKPADLETGATGTADAYINILKAAVEKYTEVKNG